ncbi:MAG TPA: hypothetical protein EYP85_13175 [Armatimonadetes bacterium]|nr:hypothetical protein [Armatimonadota bacterium]
MGFPKCHKCHEQLRQCQYCRHWADGACTRPESERPPLQEEEGAPYRATFDSRLVEDTVPLSAWHQPLTTRAWILIMLLVMALVTLGGLLQLPPAPPLDVTLRLNGYCSRFVRLGETLKPMLCIFNPSDRYATGALIRIPREFFRRCPLTNLNPRADELYDIGRYRYLYYRYVPPSQLLVIEITCVARYPGDLTLEAELYNDARTLQGKVKQRITILPRLAQQGTLAMPQSIPSQRG